MEKNIIVSFEQAVQVGEYDYKTFLRTKLCEPTTTISDIMEWANGYTKCLWVPQFTLSETD